jgi:type 1 glutamine amidotransferase
MKKAIIVWGGWDGHTPDACAEVLKPALEGRGYTVDVSDTLEAFEDAEKLLTYDVIIPIWTMGELSGPQKNSLMGAIESGVGLAGFHGGMGDAFRGNVEYEWMTGGIFVGHPHVGDYVVDVTVKNEITEGLPARFDYNSEQYYMLTDPGNNVIATTVYDIEGKAVTMPVIWTKKWKEGKVFYSALGHVAEEFTTYPAVLEMTLRGIEWATR